MSRRWLRLSRQQALAACFVLGLIMAIGFAGLRIVQENARAAEQRETKQAAREEARR